MNVVSLTDCIKLEKVLVGSKAMNLSKIKSTIPLIPDGFVLTSDSFKKFLTHNNIRSKNNRHIQEEVLTAEYPRELELSISKFFNAIKTSPDVILAVRSSSAMEDLNNASFAGQYETILNVKNLDQLLDSIKRCWASYFSAHILDYAKTNNISLSDVQMGVFVQQMINADVSGVIFSSNPVTNNQNEILVNASYGLGEAIVDGSVTPDMYVINKENKHIVKELGDKKIQIIAKEEGNESVVVSTDLQKIFCLGDEEILELVDITMKIENYFENPVDIEFAIKNNIIYILQSRPITTLKGENV
ncbi:PEP/pyruvate-binding domain-containing protein [Bacillus sp. SCS-151]|uniref:PEP/pyruvate-binding domain-containing protein n=1 Tax=Nanhaiella sioensis TaxID=3115293 RepID=UPI00397B0C76